MAKNLDSFNEFLAKDQKWPVELAKQIWDVTEYDRKIDQWLRWEVNNIRAWLFGNPDKSYEKWKRFTHRWLKKSYNDMTISEEAVFQLKADLKSAELEIRRLKYGKKEAEPTAIGDILAKVERKTP